jgi:poly(A) polymerase
MLRRLKKLLAGRARGKRAVPLPGSEPAAGREAPAPPAPAGPPPLRVQDIDPDAVKIVRRLVHHGHTAYLVGGCVRDLLLGRRPKDVDISTSATPRQVKALFRNCRIIGRRFKLAHVFFRRHPDGDEKIIEVSTFRARVGEDGEVSDLLITRDNTFGTPQEDARRRDFTVNALFYDLEAARVIDHAGGIADLRARILRTIGDPDIRLREDPVRILRAVKFAARLDFRIDPATLAAMQRHRAEISRSAVPRVLEELLRILRSGAAVPAFALLGESRVLEVLLPEIDSALGARPQLADAYLGVLAEIDRRAARGSPPEPAVIFASLFLPLLPWGADDAARPGDLAAALGAIVEPVVGRLRIPHRDADAVRRILLSIHKLVPGYRARRFSRAALARRDTFPLLLEVFAIHCRATGRWPGAVAEWEALAGRRPPQGRHGRDRAPGGAGPARGAPPRRRRRRRRRGAGAAGPGG